MQLTSQFSFGIVYAVLYRFDLTDISISWLLHRKERLCKYHRKEKTFQLASHPDVSRVSIYQLLESL